MRERARDGGEKVGGGRESGRGRESLYKMGERERLEGERENLREREIVGSSSVSVRESRGWYREYDNGGEKVGSGRGRGRERRNGNVCKRDNIGDGGDKLGGRRGRGR